jgi:isopenicillin N synthase-like dioxygenase
VTSPIPVIDLTSLTAAAEIRTAAETVGFLVITGHGVDAAVLEEQWRQVRAFFDQPVATKMHVAMPTHGYPYGYAPFAYEQLSASLGDVAPPDLKETFAVGPVTAPRHTFTDPDEASAWSPNLWPELHGFRETSEQYFTAMADLCARLLSLIATSLDLSADYFDPFIDRHTSALRMINYPELPTSASMESGQQRAGAHTDYGTLTVLFADPKTPGLQVRLGSGEWVGPEFPPGSLIVNLGDAMARWTNDRWKSTLHRVVPGTGRRQSIAFFHNANWDALIDCLPTCLGPGETPHHQPIAAGPHLMAKFRSTIVGLDANSSETTNESSNPN